MHWTVSLRLTCNLAVSRLELTLTNNITTFADPSDEDLSLPGVWTLELRLWSQSLILCCAVI